MKRLLLSLAIAGLFAIGSAPNLGADQRDKKTILTVNEPIQVPGKLLEPGVYVMKLLESSSTRHIVQVFNEDQTEVLTTILAIPNYRLQAESKTVFTFWEMPAGHPKALRAWFYPGDNFGQEFAYPKAEAIEIAKIEHAEVPVTEAQKPEELTTAPVEEINEQGQEEPIVAQAAPAPAPVADEPVEEAQASEAPAAELPETASPYPLIGFGGMISLLLFGATRIVRLS